MLHFLLALAAGGVTVFGLAPFGLWPLQLFSIASLAWLLGPQRRQRHAALLGWAYMFAATLSSVYWLFISMHRYGGMAAPIAAAAVVLLSATMALYGALAAVAVNWLGRRTAAPLALKLLVIFPACWLLAEWLRGWLFTGFPWASSGYAHTQGPLAGYAALIGVYGLGGLAALVGACLALLPRTRLPVLLVLAILAAGAGLKEIDWTRANGRPISVRLLQGNIPQEMKFDPGHAQATLTLYENMMRAAPADLIATPETALPLLLQQLPGDYLQRLQAFVDSSGSHVLLGVPISDEPDAYANSVLGFGPKLAAASAPSASLATQPGSGANTLNVLAAQADNGAAQAPMRLYRYDKHHLVPFGEFIPAGARWFVNLMAIPLGDFTRGPVVQAPFEVKQQWILPNICYEDLFGEEIADQIASSYFTSKREPTILLNMSNIGWFGDSIALPQHLQISRMRTLETGRPMLRATNTGATAIIDAKGQVEQQLPPFTRGTLSASVQGRSGWTPYILLGNSLPVGLAFAVLLGIWIKRRRKT